MITIDFTPDAIDALHRERFHHPHPRVQEKMEAVSLKSQGPHHKEICRLSRISENTLRSSPRQSQEGGHRATRAARLRQGPPANWPTIARRWRITSART